jgi:hypothetical protein
MSSPVSTLKHHSKRTALLWLITMQIGMLQPSLHSDAAHSLAEPLQVES